MDRKAPQQLEEQERGESEAEEQEAVLRGALELLVQAGRLVEQHAQRFVAACGVLRDLPACAESLRAQLVGEAAGNRPGTKDAASRRASRPWCRRLAAAARAPRRPPPRARRRARASALRGVEIGQRGVDAAPLAAVVRPGAEVVAAALEQQLAHAADAVRIGDAEHQLRRVEPDAELGVALRDAEARRHLQAGSSFALVT